MHAHTQPHIKPLVSFPMNATAGVQFLRARPRLIKGIQLVLLALTLGREKRPGRKRGFAAKWSA